ncbi:hypothetical protein V8G54_036361 [Vigna mungo]|uniref:Uncharacterized protein n=1 Tax=Vigna mungo TaxID=3915 RepID=A0AAQ3MGS8_VIGMU
MPPKGKGKGESKSKANDAPKSSPKKKTGTSKSPRKPKPIPEDSAAESSSSTPKKKKTGSSKSPNKRKKNTEESAEEPVFHEKVSENEPIYDLLNPPPSHNEYLEHAMFFKEPKIEEPEIPDVPPLLPPGFEEPPRSFGGLEEIVESAKQLNRRKD